jgi:hypothetical protein
LGPVAISIELCTACIRDLWGPRNLVALTVAKLDDTPLYITDGIRIVFGLLTDYPLRFLQGRRHQGTVGLAQLFVSHHERWSLVLSSWHVCHVVRLIPCKVILIRISATPSDMGEACSLCLNVEVLYHHVHEIYG